MCAANRQQARCLFEMQAFGFRPALLLFCITTVAWLVGLLTVFDPTFSECSGTPFNLTANSCGSGCLTWDQVSAATGSWRASFVEVLHPYVYGHSARPPNEMCFSSVSTFSHFIYWIFAVVELLSSASFGLNVLLTWRVRRRGAKPLNKMMPPFPLVDWPTVDVLLCHYTEPAEETIETLRKLIDLQYPPRKLHIYICDDGHLKSDFRAVDAGTARAPKAVRNESAILTSGDVRIAVANLFRALAARDNDELDRESNEGHGSGDGDEHRASATSGLGRMHYAKTREVFPEVTSAARAVPRADCAFGFAEDRYELPGLPVVSYVARAKPRMHHSKSGNVNNVLYNVQSLETGGDGEGRYVAIFDNDMQPHPEFLVSTLPLFFEEAKKAPPPTTAPRFAPPGKGKRGELLAERLETELASVEVNSGPAEAERGLPTYDDDPEVNQVGWVQTPQYFKPSYLVDARGDPLSHSLRHIFDSTLPAMDGFDSCSFVGTNAVWRRRALDSVGGLQYGTVSEDTWTSQHAFKLGWKSAYLSKEHFGAPEERFRLAEGNVPDNSATAARSEHTPAHFRRHKHLQ